MILCGKLIFLLIIGVCHGVFQFQPEQIHLSFGGNFKIDFN